MITTAAIAAITATEIVPDVTLLGGVEDVSLVT
jgi:hypothetical protein